MVIQCTRGRDRTGLIAGAYRMDVLNWTFGPVEEERKLYGATGLIDDLADAKIIDFLKHFKN